MILFIKLIFILSVLHSIVAAPVNQENYNDTSTALTETSITEQVSSKLIPVDLTATTLPNSGKYPYPPSITPVDNATSISTITEMPYTSSSISEVNTPSTSIITNTEPTTIPLNTKDSNSSLSTVTETTNTSINPIGNSSPLPNIPEVLTVLPDSATLVPKSENPTLLSSTLPNSEKYPSAPPTTLEISKPAPDSATSAPKSEDSISSPSTLLNPEKYPSALPTNPEISTTPPDPTISVPKSDDLISSSSTLPNPEKYPSPSSATTNILTIPPGSATSDPHFENSTTLSSTLSNPAKYPLATTTPILNLPITQTPTTPTITKLPYYTNPSSLKTTQTVTDKQPVVTLCQEYAPLLYMCDTPNAKYVISLLK